MAYADPKSTRGKYFVYLTAVLGLIAGCIGLGHTGLKIVNESLADRPKQQTVHIYHHAPFWEELVREVIENKLLIESADRIKVPVPSKPLPVQVSRVEQEPWVVGGLLALTLLSFALLLRRRHG